ncbi:LuxR C-terminal-related transcriptional regulator [Novipirellula sp. SH528]|uniref:LuxR C-terminal-related transcriptional regulator n=1 Tax=Novipirellula sp. SH528 TaxID=3454466 RepID=UPI003F9EE3B2
MKFRSVEMSNRIDSAHQIHSRTFELAKTQVVNALLQWAENAPGAEPDLSRFTDCVYIKDAHGCIIRENQALCDAFANGGTMIGHKVGIDDTCNHLDAILLLGNPWVECQHYAPNGDGRMCVLQTYKRRLDEINDPAFCMLGISRILGFVDKEEDVRRLSLREQFAVFNSLDDIDHTICHMIAEGESTKDIAASVSLTTKSIENRRQRIMTSLGLRRPVEIVKLLVRLEENRMIDRLR